ncbi:Com2p RNJ42_04969 [Nakaseomyces bracarensis]|uniref:Com2p n=1 Tax=Nakaseomyces bracarensis TaxID=273131 RepID=UPI0038712D10
MSNFQLVHSDLTGNTLTQEVENFEEDEYDMLRRHSISDYMQDKSRYYEYEKFDDISTVVLPADNYIQASQTHIQTHNPSKTNKMKTYFNNFFNNGIWSSYKRNKSNASTFTEPEMLVDEVTLNDEKMDYEDTFNDNNDNLDDFTMDDYDGNTEHIEVFSVNPRKVFSTVDDIALSQRHDVNFHSIINQSDDNQFYLHHSNPYEISDVGDVNYSMDFEDSEDDSPQDQYVSMSHPPVTHSTTNKEISIKSEERQISKNEANGTHSIKISSLPQKTRGRKPSLVPDFSKQFGCEFCDRRFKRQEHLKRHVRSLHMGEKPFECHICNKKFSRSDNLNQHIKTHTH